MENIKDLLRAEINEFRNYGQKFIDKEISIMDFKSKSGGMGVYAQKGGEKFMIRLRIKSGVLSIDEAKLIVKYINKYNIEKIHLTTRQAIQLHDLKFNEVCDIMEDSLDNNLYTRGGGGNFPRNVALSPLSGVEIGEAFDVTPYAVLVNEYFMKRMNTYKLPRKLKVSFSNNVNDTANSSVTDLGFVAYNENGENYFKLFMAGGLGRKPAVGVEYDEKVSCDDVLYYVEAMIRLFVNEGNYENKHEARTRFIVERMGKNDFFECYKKYLNAVKKELKLDKVNVNPYEVNKEASKFNLQENRNLIRQKQKGLYTVIIKPFGGQLESDYFKKIIDFCKGKNDVQLRLSMEESLFVRNLQEDEALELLKITDSCRKTTNLGMSLSCIGVPTCQIGIEKSQKMLKDILDYFDKNNMDNNILPNIYISGCGNSCARHQLAEIGFEGTRKRIDGELKDCFNLFIDGKNEIGSSKLGKDYGTITVEKIPEFLYAIAVKLKEQKTEFITWYKNNISEFEEILNSYLA